MVIIKLQGGLGNQMFQYAFSRILAEKNKSALKLDLDFYKSNKNNQGTTPRNFELGIFDQSYIVATQNEIHSLTQLSFFDKLIQKTGFYQSKKYEESTLDFQADALMVKAPVYIIGYFQSYLYFKGFEKLISNFFSFPIHSLDQINSKLLYQIKACNTISIHIRRGDYIENKVAQQFHGNCSLAYYLNAINILASEENEVQLIFFSDDSVWVKEQFNDLPHSKIFIDHKKNENSWIDMLLMSTCNHNIIANSTFSWWAAWLNDNSSKKVIAPKYWFANTQIDATDLIPSEWIRL